MARQMTNAEKTRFRGYFQNLNVDRAVVTDDATNVYNCISWTLGITNRWIWPGQNIRDFDNLYRKYGYKRAKNGPIAAWGHSRSRMTHGCISGRGHGPRWESKCGRDLRIQHGLRELKGATYGRVVAFYAHSRALALQSGVDEIASEGGVAEMRNVSESEERQIDELVSKVPDELVDRFEDLFAKWMNAINTNQMVVFSSDPTLSRTLPEFFELTALGEKVLPLVVKKLLDPQKFFAIQVYEALQANPALLVNFEGEDDDRVLEGEQGRAIRIAAHWLSSQ